MSARLDLDVFGWAIGRVTDLQDEQMLVEDMKSEFLDRQADQLERSMVAVQNFIVAGLVVNVVLALALVLIYSQGINKRLHLLMENVKSLNDGDALPHSVGGSDEIQVLDEALQRAKMEIGRAVQQRRFFATRIADSMRSPLVVAASMLEDIEPQVSDDLPHEAASQLIVARNNLIRVTKLIEGVVALDELESGRLKMEKQRLPLTDIMEESLEAVHSLAREKHIDLIDSTRPVYVDADKERIVQVLTNLLSNAIKFSPEKSQVEISCNDADTAVSISVRDQGPGIDSAVTGRIFDRYFQQEGSQKSQGFGIGLAVVKQIVEAHGGQVAVAAAPNHGSIFSISFPKEKVTADGSQV